MKELSIEEKAKRHDEILVKLQEAKVDNNVCDERYCCVIDDIVPELKDSEDEKIMEALIRYFTISDEHAYNKACGVSYRDIVAWLENQNSNVDNANKEYWRGYREGKQEILDKYADLEKQGEQKPNANCLLSWSEIEEKMLQSLEGIVKDYWAKAEQENNEIKIKEASEVSFFLKTIHKSPLCWIKCSDELPNRDGTYLVVTDGRHNDAYDMARYDPIEGWHKASEIIYWMPIPQLNNKSIIEQNHANKIKPKFHKGDWTTSNLDGKARQISEVHFDKYNSYYVVDGKSVNLEEYDRLHHLWTIQDAKDGDTLCTYECNEPKIVFILKGTPKKHYALGYHCYYNIMYPHFASDSEKGCLAPNDEDVKPATKEQCDLLFQKMKEAGYKWNVEKKELIKITDKSADKIESDKKFTPIESALKDLICDVDNSYTIEQVRRFLFEYGYKDKILNAAQEEMQKPASWSEEDEDIRDNIIRDLKRLGGDMVSPNQAYQKEIYWLKSLRPQLHWKLSEEDCNRISSIKYLLHELNNYNFDNWLDSLKDRYTWKPSDEQMTYIQNAISKYNEFSNEYTGLVKLYNELKKLRNESV